MSAGRTAARNHLQTRGIVDALNADARLPAVIKGKAVAAVIVTAVMYQPPDSPVLFIIQTDGVIGHARPSAGWVLHESLAQCSA